MGNKVSTFRSVLSEAGLAYFVLFSVRWLLLRLLSTLRDRGRLSGRLREGALVPLERVLVRMERAKSITAPWAASASRFTPTDNRMWWNSHDWCALGEEWTPSVEWKRSVLDRFMVPYIPAGGAVLEIGPGAGRWTEVLARIATTLYVLDVAERPLSICKQRFREKANIEYLLGDGRTIAIPDGTLDGVWSYDVFVHVNPSDAATYFSEIRRVLRPGSYAVIHHPGRITTSERQREHRSDLTDRMVARLAALNGLDVVLQTTELVNVGDVLTVLRKS